MCASGTTMIKSHIVIILSGFFLLTGAEEVRYCRNQECGQDTNCIGTPCLHGSCDDSGTCICHGCWTGDGCDTQGNPHLPYFLATLYDVTVRADHAHDIPLVKVEAADEDSCPQDEDCGCARIKYTILEGNDLGQLSINPNTGEIFADGLVDFANGVSKRMYLTVGAENERYSMYGRTGTEAMVLISIEGGPPNNYGGFKANYAENSYSDGLPDIEFYGDTEEVHRIKRELNSEPLGVDNVTFHLSKTGSYENVTLMRVGSKVHFQLGIQFPMDTSDIQVELFTPDNDTTKMILCNVEIVSVGNALLVNDVTILPEEIDITMEAKEVDSYDYDRAIVPIGNVTYSGGASTAMDEMIVLEWDVVMIKNQDTQNNSEYWVSAGAEYNNEENIWVGQASFTAITDEEDIADNPVFNFTGPENVALGSTTVFRVDMHIPFPSVDLILDVFAPINDTGVMSVCNILVVDTGDHYSCLPKEKIEYTLYEASNAEGNDRGRLSIGIATNAGYEETMHSFPDNLDPNRISVEFAVQVLNNTDYVGNDYYVGVAVEIGSDLIWAGQLQVTVIENDILPAMPSDPTVKLTTLMDTDVVIGQTVVYELNVTFPQNSEALYQLEVLGSYNDSARMKICEVTILAQGINVPCFAETFPVHSSRDGSNITDRTVWALPRIRNTGQREAALDPYADIVSFRIAVQILNHTLNAPGERVPLIVGLTVNDDKLWVGKNLVTISGDAQTITAPSFTMDYGFGTDQVEIGGAAQVNFEITTPPSSVYDPMVLEFIMPYEDNSTVMRVCRTEMLSKGNNLPCLDQAAVNSSVVYLSKNDDEVYDMVTSDMGTVCNIKESDDNDTTEDTITYSVIVQLLDHANLVHGSKKWVGAGVTYTTTRLYVSQLAMFTVKDSPASYPGPEEPFIDINRTDSQPDGETTLTVGIPATYLLTIKPLPQARADYTVYVTASTGISVCLLHIKEVGWNLPCVETAIEANYTQHSDSDYNMEARLEFGTVTNVADEAVVSDQVFDNNTITVEVVVMAYETGNTLTLDVSVDYGPSSPGSPKDVATLVYNAISLVTPIVTKNDTMPTFNFAIAGVDENQTVSEYIAKGQTYLFHLDIYPAENSQNHMSVKFLTPVNETAAMEVCSVNVIYVGKNIACMKKKVVNEGNLYESRNSTGNPEHSYIDIGTVDLGHVCHMPLDDTEPDNNLIRVEAVAKVTANNTLSVGEKIWFSSTVRLNEDQIYVTQLALIIDDNFDETITNLTGEASVTLNVSAGALPMSPGEIYDIPVIVQVPANVSVTAYLDVRLPMNDSAVMTVHHVEVIEAGENIGCIASNPDKEIFTIYNSTGETTQNDYVRYDFFIITNSGVTYRKDTYEDGDDSFVVLVQVQMTDAEVNTHGSEHIISVGVKLAETVFIAEKTVVVVRAGDEIPDLLLTADMNMSKIYDTVDDIIIEAMLQHTNESSAEGYNVTATFYFPPFMEYVLLVAVNFTQPVITDSNEGHGLQFQFDSLYFTDIVAFSFQLKVNSSVAIPLSESPVNATTPFEAGGNIIHRVGHQNESSSWFVTRVDSLSFGVIGPHGLGCDAVPLGMQDGRIQDCQIDGSESLDDTRLPKEGRKGSTSGWTAGTRAGEFSRYMQVDFGNVTKVTQVTLLHQGGAGYSRVNDLQLIYSDDSINWEEYTPETLTADPGYSETTLNLLIPVQARYMRLVLQNDQSTTLMPSLQVEFHGCSSTSDKTPEQVCSERETSWLTQQPSSLLYSRSLLVVGTSQYFCDTNPTKNNKMECFTKGAGPVIPLDESVVTILGYDSETGELYGLAWDKRSVVTSEDEGQTWMSVSQQRYDEAKIKPSWSGAAEVPYIKTVNVADFASVEARYDGIYESNTLVTTWDTCC